MEDLEKESNCLEWGTRKKGKQMEDLEKKSNCLEWGTRKGKGGWTNGEGGPWLERIAKRAWFGFLDNGPSVGPTKEENTYTHSRHCAQAATSELFFTIEMREFEDRQNMKVVALRVFFPTM